MTDKEKEKKPTVKVIAISLYGRQDSWIEKEVQKLHRLGMPMNRSKFFQSLIDKEIEAERSAEKKGGK